MQFLGIPRPLQGSRWCALGTSITQLNLYPPRVASLTGMTLTNIAVSGASISSSSTYLPSGFVSQVSSIPLDADVVTIEAGINDFRGSATLGTIADTTLSTFYGALHKTITDVIGQDQQRLVAFILPYPNTPADIYQSANYLVANANGNTYLQFCNAVIEKCKQLNVPVITTPLVGGPSGAAYLSDGVHLSSPGSIMMARAISNQITLLPRVRRRWTFRNALVSDLSGTRLSGITIDGNGIVQYTVPNNGSDPLNWASLWMADGTTNNACEFEVAEPEKSLWLTLGRHASTTSWIGKGDPGFEPGRFNFIGLFSQLGSLIQTQTVAPVTNNIGSYATKWRIGRIGAFVVCQGLVSGKWLTAFNIDLDQQKSGFNDVTPEVYSIRSLGLLINSGYYTKVKNVRVGTLELV